MLCVIESASPPVFVEYLLCKRHVLGDLKLRKIHNPVLKDLIVGELDI